MKTLLLLATPILITGCSTKTAPVVRTRPASVPGTTLPSTGIERVRYSENIKGYPLGRYVDPGNSLVMHEGHVLYRVETTGKWNLHPNEPVGIPRGPMRIADSARSASPVNDELVAEINRQKDVTRTLIRGSEAVSSQLDQLAVGVKQTRQVAAESTRIKTAVDETNQRLDALERQIRQQTTTPPPDTDMPDNLDW